VEIIVKGGYSPNLIRVQEGVPLRLVFDRQENSDCSSRVVFPDFGVSKSLAAFGRTAVELMPARARQFGFACGMNMLHGTLVVEAENGNGSATASSETAGSADAAAVVAAHGEDDHTHEVARAVGVGPVREVKGTSRVEFGLRRGSVTCPTCVRNIESVLDGMAGVDDVDVNFGAEAAARRAEIRDLTRRVVVGAVLTAPVLLAVMATDIFDANWVPDLLMNRWVQLAFIAPVMLYTGWPIHRTGWLTLRNRTADMNTLIAIGTTAAFVYSLVVTTAPSALPEDLQDVYFVRAVEAGDEAAFDRSLEALLAGVRETGRPVPDDYLGPSDLVLPGPDATIEDVRALLSEEGLIPG
jgi:Cu+-exporting ATPase